MLLRQAAVAALAALLGLLVTRPTQSAEAPPPAEDSSLYLESDRDASKLLDAARAAARQGNWRQAADAYQRVAEFAGKTGAQPLAASDPAGTVYIPVQQAAALEMARLPAAAIAAYREACDAAAQALLDKAFAARDPALLAAVADRYLASSSGDDALAALGAIAFERADYAGALAAWGRILEVQASPSVPIASLKARMWLCYKALGQQSAAARLAEELRAKHGDESLRLAGRSVTVLEFLKPQVGQESAPPLGDWPALGGDATGGRVSRGVSEVGEPAWRFLLPGGGAGAGRHPSPSSPAPLPLPLQATVAGDRVFLADDAAAYALDIESGRVLWLYPDAPTVGPTAPAGETLHAVACAGDRAFARLGQTLACFDRDTGRLLWRRAFAEPKPVSQAEPPEPKPDPKAEPAKDEPKAPRKKGKGKDKGEKSLGSKVTLILTPPVVAGPRVFVGLTHLGEEARASLVALDAATGHELWRTFVCSRSIPATLGLGASPSPPVVSGGTAYLATNLGAVAAVDVASGIIRWVHRYGAFPTHLRRVVIERDERWAANPPVAAHGMLFVTPQDAPGILAIDAVRGTLAWSAPREDDRYFAAAEAGRVFLVGAQVQALDALTGKRLWASALPAKAAGRPALCQGRLYVPLETQLVAVQTGDGTLTTCRLWQPNEEPGNLTATDRALFVAARDRLYALADWATTQETLAARRKEKPDDPLAPLTLGLHEAHRGAFAAAVAPLEEALRLATAAKDAEAARRARQGIFDACLSLGTRGDAAALATALVHAPNPQAQTTALLAAARLHEAQGRHAEAVAAWQRLIEEHAATPCRTEGGLAVTGHALGTAEIARIVREHGRPAYAAVEAAAAKALAAAKTDSDAEAVARQFPNSAAAEQALLRLLASPNAQTLVPHLAALAHSLAPEPASEARKAIEAGLKAASAGARSTAATLSPRWQVQTRIGHRKVEVVELPGAPQGCLYFATARRMFDRALPFDGIECRQAETGQLVWERELSDWDTLGLVAGAHLLMATFDQVIAVDPTSGVERWTASVAAPGDPLKPEDEGKGEPPPKKPPFERGRVDEEAPWRPAARRRNERTRIVALAAGQQAVYAALAGGQVCAFSLANGARVWTRQLDARVLLSRGLFVAGSKVWACAESPGAVYALNENDGSGDLAVTFQRNEAAFRLPRITDRPVYVPSLGRLYVVVDDHTVHALDLKEGRDLWAAYLEVSINRVLASEDGGYCYVLPDSFLHNAQIVSLKPNTGAVRRRRSVLGGSMTDAALGADALYVAERDNDNALAIEALDPDDLTERWRSAPLPLAQPSGLACGDGLVAIAGRHSGQRSALLLHAATGRILGDVQPAGANDVAVALVGGLLVLGTDRGIHAYGPSEREALDQRIALFERRLAGGDRAALPALAAALYQRGDEARGIELLARALTDEKLPISDYATLKDLLNSLRESLALRRPAELLTAWMPVPPNIDGAIDEPWAADRAAYLDGPQFIDEIQGIPAAESRWRSPSDLSAVLYTGWDARHFYFAVDVSDDVHRTYTSQTETWIGDGLIISVDCENDGGYGYRFTSKDLLLTLALTRKDERRDEDDDENEPSGEYRVRIKEDNSGCVYEIALPWDYMGISDPKPGLRFGFNVTVTDDDGDRAVKAISWSPGMLIDRDRTSMVRGFTPALFGKVVLTGPSEAAPPLWAPPAPAPPRRDDQIRVHRIRPSKER